MSEVSYRRSYTTSDNTGGYGITWDQNVWYPNNSKLYNPDENASKADIAQLQKEIYDLRKVLSELIEILGGHVEKKVET